MPSISMFYGIIIYMYVQDDKRHKLPHIHAKYAEEEAVFDLNTGDIIEGKIPAKKAHLVKAWILMRQEDLMADWNLAVAGERLYAIDPLK